MVWQTRLPQPSSERLSEKLTISLLYHDIFDYPLREKELLKWVSGDKLKLITARPRVRIVKQLYCIKGREKIIEDRLKKEKISREKMKILSKARFVFDMVPSILMVGITGSLAMVSSSKDSDIDLLIVVKKGTLWTTRLKVLYLMFKHRVPVRRAKEKESKDRICLNMWMDRNELEIKGPRNAYTAHELAQIIPLINKEYSYEGLISANKWIIDYWPKAVSVDNFHFSKPTERINILSFLFEKIAYFLQIAYMLPKRTCETISPTRAFFHPFNWSEKVIKELQLRGVVDCSL